MGGRPKRKGIWGYKYTLLFVNYSSVEEILNLVPGPSVVNPFESVLWCIILKYMVRGMYSVIADSIHLFT